VLSRLDYGNATLAGFPANLLNRLQSVLNASARSIAGLHRSAHITDNLASFHCLRAPQRIKFKLAVIVYRALTALRRDISRTLSVSLLLTFRLGVVSARRPPVNSWSARHILSPSGSGRSSQPVRDSGIVSQTTSRLPRHCQTFVVNSKQIFLGNHIRTLVVFLATVDLEVVSYGTFVSDIAIFIIKRER